MRTELFAAVLSLACLAGCSEKPMEAVAKEHLVKSLRAELGGAVSVTAFEKTGAAEGVMFGLKFCDLEYSYEILCKLPVPIKPLRRFSIENVVLLDEFFKGRTEPWEKLDFTPVRRVRLDDAVRGAVAEAYAEKRSLLLCKPGQKVTQTGSARLLLRQEGWAVE